MERLTERYGDGYIGVKGCTTAYLDKERKGAYLHNAIVRFAAYEDTELTPGEIERMKEYMKPFTIQDMDRFRKIMDAEKDDRLVVLAVNPYLKPAQANEVFICENGGVWPIYVTGCEVGSNGEGRMAVIYETIDGDLFCDTDIGKTIFLTRQKAEEALREEGAE